MSMSDKQTGQSDCQYEERACETCLLVYGEQAFKGRELG